MPPSSSHNTEILLYNKDITTIIYLHQGVAMQPGTKKTLLFQKVPSNQLYTQRSQQPSGK